MNHLLTALIAVTLSVTSLMHAQEVPTIRTDRPDQTETPALVPVDHIQVEAGFSTEKLDENLWLISHPSLLLRYGLIPWLELRAIVELHTRRSNVTHSGLGGVDVGVKLPMWEEQGFLPKTSFIGHVSVPPLVAMEFRTTNAAPSFRFTMQHSMSEDVSLSYNLGSEWDGERTAPTYIYTLASGISLGTQWGCYVELFGFITDGVQSEHLVDGGFTFLPQPNVQFDLSGGFGLTPASSSHYVAVGCSFRLPR